jgi:hypothetical protein
MKTMLKYLLPVLVVLAVLAAQAGPVQAGGEPPPPGGEPSGKHNSSSDPVRPPSTPPDQVANAVEAVYQADAVLTDSHGNTVPLASKLAIGVLAGPLATACPSGVIPTWLGGSGLGCHTYSTASPITSAIGSGTTLANWTVWVESAPAPYVETVTVNKSIILVGEDAATTAITGNVTLAAPNTTLMQFTINGEVKATGQSGYVHLQDLIIRNPNLPGIEISGQKGNIVLNNVVSNGNSLGATLEALGSGTVTVINSVFNDNTDNWGLKITAGGKVRMENVIASDNTHGDGVLIVSSGGVVTVNNAIFEGNGTALTTFTSGNGLEINQTGLKGPAVTLTNVLANDNNADGVKVFGAASVAVNLSAFQSNKQYGLDIEGTKGAVTLNGIFAAYNDLNGALVMMQTNGAVTVINSEFDSNTRLGLEVDAKGGPVTLKNDLALDNFFGFYVATSGTASPVSISKTIAGLNSDYGFLIDTNGAITLNNVTAFSNGTGMYLDHCDDDGVKCTVTSAITLSNSLGLNEFSGNVTGLDIETGGPVTLTGLKVMDNEETGVAINSSGDYISTSNVSITNADIAVNQGDGLAIETNGTVTLNKVTAVYNSANGAWLGDVMAPKSVSITASEFSFNDSDGLDVHAAGAINVDHLFASDNGGSGANLFSAGGAVNLTSKTGNNQFWANGGYGLGIDAKGTISVKDTIANFNQKGAIRLDNCWMGVLSCNNLTASTVTLSNVFMDNNLIDAAHPYALSIRSTGTISLDKVFIFDTVGNDAFPGWAMQADNSGVVKGTPAISITNSEFSFGNHSGGMLVHSLGIITLNHVSSSYNNRSSTSNAVVEINNCIGGSGKCLGTGNVSILNTLGNNAFDGNTDQSLWVVTTGSITLKGVSASYSKSHGAVLDNTNATKANPVTITNSQFNNNGWDGLMVSSVGAITLNNVEADFNGITGAFLTNRAFSATAAKPGIIITTSQFNLNQKTGLSASSQGNIALDNITASDNLTYGVTLDTCRASEDDPVCTGAGTVTITNKLGDNRFLNNGGTGLSVTASKAITITGVNASSNGGEDGALLDTCIWEPASHKCLGVGDVSVSQSLFSGNTGNGLTVKSSGKITLTSVDASGNQMAGANLANTFTLLTTTPVTITSSIFDNNGDSGLEVMTRSNLILNNVSASGNRGDYGAMLDTCDSTTPICNGSGTVTILSKLGPNAFNNNDGVGLYIASKGAVSMDRVSVANNGVGRGMNGAEIWLDQPSTPAVFISCSLFTGSGNYGLMATTNALLTLKGTLVAGNHKDGGSGELDYTGTAIRQWVYCGY